MILGSQGKDGIEVSIPLSSLIRSMINVPGDEQQLGLQNIILSKCY